jgi:hypothetical protein
MEMMEIGFGNRVFFGRPSIVLYSGPVTVILPLVSLVETGLKKDVWI